MVTNYEFILEGWSSKGTIVICLPSPFFDSIE